MRATYLAAILVVTVTPALAQSGADAEYNADYQACTNGLNNASIKTAVALENCTDGAMRRYMVRQRFSWMDLEDREEAQHLRSAELYDSKQITLQELAAENNRADAEFTEALNARLAAHQQQQQNQQQASALAQQRAQICAGAAMAGAGDPRNWYANMLAAQGDCNIQRQQLAPQTPYADSPLPLPATPRRTYCQPVGDGISCTEQ